MDMLYMLILLFKGHYIHHERACVLCLALSMYNMSIAYNTVYFSRSNVVCGSGPRYPFRNANIIAISISSASSLLKKKRRRKKNSPPGIKADAYITLVIGLKSSAAISGAPKVNSIYGSQEVMMASAKDLRSTARSFSEVCSDWHWTPRQVPNSRKARRYLMLWSR